jgi:5-(carboxyamino)imidazole ribonucleotide synthase
MPGESPLRCSSARNLRPLPPGSTIGILGGGQLGRLLATAAAKLGLHVAIFEPEAGCPASDVAASHHCAPYDDAAALAAFARAVDVVTLEFENVPVNALTVIEPLRPVFPSPLALQMTQDRIAEKAFIASLGLPVGTYEPLASVSALYSAYTRLTGHSGDSLFLKRSRLGYDGKGQLRIASTADLPAAIEWLGDDSAVLEAAVPFALEISIIAVRGHDGGMAFYDPPHNTHAGGILRESIVPAPISPTTQASAEDYTRRIAEALDYVGVLAVEMFVVRDADGTEHLLINEIAPRVHNSGHWTPEACAVSQFENHIRAVAGWPLGATTRHSDARMVNVLGETAHDWYTLLSTSPSRALTLYGKVEARPGRKMGHYVDIIPC